jgi:hypothetical protein
MGMRSTKKRMITAWNELGQQDLFRNQYLGDLLHERPVGERVSVSGESFSFSVLFRFGIDRPQTA